MAINNKPASSYAKPHTMSGSPVSEATVSIGYKSNPNNMNASESTPGGMPSRDVSIGNKIERVKSEGVVTRGNGCATKGLRARGPMA